MATDNNIVTDYTSMFLTDSEDYIYTATGSGGRLGAGSSERTIGGDGQQVLLIHSTEYCTAQNKATERFEDYSRAHLNYDAELVYTDPNQKDEIIQYIGKTFGWQ